MQYAQIVLRRVDSAGEPNDGETTTKGSVELRIPYPEALRGLTVHRAKRVRALVDGHELEAIDIYASTEGDEECHQSAAFEILYADSALVSYLYNAGGLACAESAGRGDTDKISVLATWLDDGELSQYYVSHYTRDRGRSTYKEFDTFERK